MKLITHIASLAIVGYSMAGCKHHNTAVVYHKADYTYDNAKTLLLLSATGEKLWVTRNANKLSKTLPLPSLDTCILRPDPKDHLYTLFVPPMQRASLTFSDSTKVYIDAGSTFRFPDSTISTDASWHFKQLCDTNGVLLLPGANGIFEMEGAVVIEASHPLGIFLQSRHIWLMGTRGIYNIMAYANLPLYADVRKGELRFGKYNTIPPGHALRIDPATKTYAIGNDSVPSR